MSARRRVCCFRSAWCFAVLAIGGCSEDKAPPPPHLMALEILDPALGVIPLLGADAGSPAAVSPLASIRATFDQLLDPTQVQDLSGAAPQPGRGVAKLVWQSASGTSEVALLADYNPSKRQNFGPAPTLTFVAPSSLPAGVRATLVLSRERIIDKQGRAYEGASGASFDTQPFTATVALPQNALPFTFTPRIAFSSLPAAAPAAAVSVFAGDAPVPIEVAIEANARTVWLISPLGEGVPWARGPHRLVLAPDRITDTFGTPLPAGTYEFPFVIGGGVDAGAADASAP